ncbi:hypothetical protein SAMN02745219_02600 [Desulfofundulus thermosubterraneus DSM 16057]|uniref:Polymerase/histidinol phosphatase N-terminal domain-containing protein n=1 Tax=Desulfofundulus thermosubterraneus DSM 16057 TaxID=1121432 RepID=A0A1M6JFK9_9FIRM|nr:hypothetical protein SAMN02745219_02600 [Desulfofundulus thermosubterraneus DSM 16057]
MSVDFHTHPLADRYYCSFTSPRVPTLRDAEDIAEFLAAASSRGIDVIAVTDHDCVASGWFAKRVAREAGLPILVVPGVEVTTNFRGWRVHVLAYNLKEDLPPNTLAPWEAVEEVHVRGGVAVLAHPARNGEYGPEIFFRCLNAGVDGVEVRNRMNGNFDPAYWLGEKSEWNGRLVMQTAGSDWHWYGSRLIAPGDFSVGVPVDWLIGKGLITPEEAGTALSRRAAREREKRGNRGKAAGRRKERDIHKDGLDFLCQKGVGLGCPSAI